MRVNLYVLYFEHHETRQACLYYQGKGVVRQGGGRLGPFSTFGAVIHLLHVAVFVNDLGGEDGAEPIVTTAHDHMAFQAQR